MSTDVENHSRVECLGSESIFQNSRTNAHQQTFNAPRKRRNDRPGMCLNNTFHFDNQIITNDNITIKRILIICHANRLEVENISEISHLIVIVIDGNEKALAERKKYKVFFLDHEIQTSKLDHVNSVY